MAVLVPVLIEKMELDGDLVMNFGRDDQWTAGALWSLSRWQSNFRKLKLNHSEMEILSFLEYNQPHRDLG